MAEIFPSSSLIHYPTKYGGDNRRFGDPVLPLSRLLAVYDANISRFAKECLADITGEKGDGKLKTYIHEVCLSTFCTSNPSHSLQLSTSLPLSKPPVSYIQPTIASDVYPSHHISHVLPLFLLPVTARFVSTDTLRYTGRCMPCDHIHVFLSPCLSPPIPLHHFSQSAISSLLLTLILIRAVCVLHFMFHALCSCLGWRRWWRRWYIFRYSPGKISRKRHGRWRRIRTGTSSRGLYRPIRHHHQLECIIDIHLTTHTVFPLHGCF